ncbi:MAG: hypothetical protein U0974_09270 [Gemmatimonadales bacterium]|nr:hypothetical protein [Gemmatimonadales bacterium]MDZ4389907.1 hypothetical protein [Gemmatimonadales bacterium]
MLDDTTMAVPALVMPGDGLSEVVRMAVRGAIEAAVESELTLALGRGADWASVCAPPPPLSVEDVEATWRVRQRAPRRPVEGASAVRPGASVGESPRWVLAGTAFILYSDKVCLYAV